MTFKDPIVWWLGPFDWVGWFESEKSVKKKKNDGIVVDNVFQ